MIFRFKSSLTFGLTLALACAATVAQSGSGFSVSAQNQKQPSAAVNGDGTPIQRLDVLRSRLEAMRRTLNTAIAAYNSSSGKNSKKDDKAKNDKSNETAEGAGRLRGLEKEVGQLLSETANLRGKQDRAEKYDVGDIANIESSVTDLTTRVEEGLRNTADERRKLGGDKQVASSSGGEGKNKKGFFGKLNPFGGGDEAKKFDELTTVVAPGRDRELFDEAIKETRKGNYDTARLLFNVIITTYSESVYLPLAKLASADTFYREGTTSALIQANAGYRDWLTFFPTHPLADRVMLKMAEAEMRQMGLPDREITHARKAEQQLKVVLQQFPKTDLRPDVEKRLAEVQENLGMHSYQVGLFYYDKFKRGTAANPRGAQSRFREIVEKYPNFSYMPEVLFNLGRTYVDEEEPDEAAKYFARLVREYPNSRFAEKAGEELERIGVARPQIDERFKDRVEPERPGLTSKIFTEILGTVPATVDKNGVLISSNDKGGDLIDEASKNGGQLPSNLTPGAVIQRTAPARVPVNNNTTATRPAAVPSAPVKTPDSTTTTPGFSLQPTRPGAPVGSSNVPAQREAQQIVQPTTQPSNTPVNNSGEATRTSVTRPAAAAVPANGTKP